MKDEISRLRHLYKDIINGYSYVPEGKIYVRHLKEKDVGEIEEKRLNLKRQAMDEGLEDEDEKIKLLIDNEIWSYEKENDINKLKGEIETLQETRGKLVLGKQIKQIKSKIKKKEKLYSDLMNERVSQVGFTAETYSDKKINEEIVRILFSKDKEFSTPFFSQEEFEELSTPDLDAYTTLYTSVNFQYSEKIIKKISICPFFLNAFFVCENNSNQFFGKPVVELTNYQIDVFSYGRYFKGIMAECERPPKDLHDDPEKLIEYYELARSSKEAKEKRQSGSNKQSEFMGSTVFGASKEELVSIAGGEGGGGELVDLSREVEGSGKDLGLNEFLKMHKK